MSRGGYKGRENFPHKFEVCSACGKKGVYERRMLYFSYTREKRCKYCKATVIGIEDYKGIYTAILALKQRGEGIDQVSVIREWGQTEKAWQIGKVISEKLR